MFDAVWPVNVSLGCPPGTTRESPASPRSGNAPLKKNTRLTGALTPRSRPTTPPVPFEEDENDASIWFLDHSYLEKMSGMFRRINGAYPTHPGAQIVRHPFQTYPRANSSAETQHLF